MATVKKPISFLDFLGEGKVNSIVNDMRGRYERSQVDQLSATQREQYLAAQQAALDGQFDYSALERMLSDFKAENAAKYQGLYKTYYDKLISGGMGKGDASRRASAMADAEIKGSDPQARLDQIQARNPGKTKAQALDAARERRERSQRLSSERDAWVRGRPKGIDRLRASAAENMAEWERSQEADWRKAAGIYGGGEGNWMSYRDRTLADQALIPGNQGRPLGMEMEYERGRDPRSPDYRGGDSYSISAGTPMGFSTMFDQDVVSPVEENGVLRIPGAGPTVRTGGGAANGLGGGITPAAPSQPINATSRQGRAVDPTRTDEYNNELIKQFLGDNPAAALYNIFPEAQGSTGFSDFVRGSQGRLYSTYLSQLPENPNMLFYDFLQNQDLGKQFKSLAPRQRGINPGMQAPPVRFLPRKVF
jgi:hypothetical protein